MWSSKLDFRENSLTVSQTLLTGTQMYSCFQSCLSDFDVVRYRRSPSNCVEYCLASLKSVQCNLYFAEGNH
jgi:hypothetical protein